MKILIPILGFAKQGGYRVLSELANNWIKMGHECTFLIPATSQNPYFPTKAKIIRCGWGGVVDSMDQSPANGLNNVISLFFGLKDIGSAYDVILANHSLTAWPVRWVNCGLARKFYYVQAYEPGYYPWVSHPFKRFFSKLSYALKLTRIANSSTYEADGVKFVAIIPPGIDLDIFVRKNLEELNFKKSEIIIGTIGRSEPYKGTATAIDAYRIAGRKNINLKMKVAFGNIEPAGDLEVIQINNDIELAAYYRSLDLLIVSCYSQHGAPHYPLIEAMASGTPVVQTNYFPGGAENTWVAKSPSVIDVANALEDLLSATREEIVKRTNCARAVVDRELSWASVAAKFIEIFEVNGNSEK